MTDVQLLVKLLMKSLVQLSSKGAFEKAELLAREEEYDISCLFWCLLA